jgi:hypothetical protein
MSRICLFGLEVSDVPEPTSQRTAPHLNTTVEPEEVIISWATKLEVLHFVQLLDTPGTARGVVKEVGNS